MLVNGNDNGSGSHDDSPNSGASNWINKMGNRSRKRVFKS